MSAEEAVAAFLKANDRAFKTAMKDGRLGAAFKLVKERHAILKETGLLPRATPPG